MEASPEDHQLHLLALYGSCMLAVQGFEFQLVLLAQLRLPPLPDDAEVEDVLVRLRPLLKKTAGQLARELSLEDDLGAEVQAAVKLRNHLAHHYLRNNATRMKTRAGAMKMFPELFRALTQIQRVSASLAEVTGPEMRARGATPPPMGSPEMPWGNLFDKPLDVD